MTGPFDASLKALLQSKRSWKSLRLRSSGP